MIKKYSHQSVFFFCLVISIVISCVFVRPVLGADPLDQKYNDLKKLEKKEQKYRELIKVKTQEAHTILDQVTQLESQSKSLEKDIEKNNTKIETLSSKIKTIKERIAKKTQAIAVQKTLLANIIRDRSEQLSPYDHAEFLFASLHAPLFNATDRVEQTTARMRDIVALIAQERASLEKNEQELRTKQQQISDAKFELEERNRRLESSQQYKKVLQTKVLAEKNTYTKKLNDVLLQQLAIQNEINFLGTTHIGTFSLADLPDRTSAHLQRPVTSPYTVTQGYGKTSFSHHYKGGFHNGIDYSGTHSRKILAASDGKILAIGHMGRYGYGNWIVLDHNDGLASLYGHLSKISVSKGEKVRRGEQIGTMGTTGFSTGVHLHFTLFARKTFHIIPSSRVAGISIPTGGTINPAIYL